MNIQRIFFRNKACNCVLECRLSTIFVPQNQEFSAVCEKKASESIIGPQNGTNGFDSNRCKCFQFVKSTYSNWHLAGLGSICRIIGNFLGKNLHSCLGSNLELYIRSFAPIGFMSKCTCRRCPSQETCERGMIKVQLQIGSSEWQFSLGKSVLQLL